MPPQRESAGIRLARARGTTARARRILDTEAEQRRGVFSQQRLDISQLESDQARQRLKDFAVLREFAVTAKKQSNTIAGVVSIMGLMIGLDVGTSLNLGGSVATLLLDTAPSEEFQTIGQIAGGGISTGMSLGKESRRRQEQGQRSRRLEIELEQPAFSQEASGRL